MFYRKLNPFIHLIYSPLDRKQVDIEIILSAGGSFYESQEDRGRMHLMEHCIASRTKLMDLNEFKNWQFRENIMINAYTSPTLLAVNSTSHREQFQSALTTCCEMMFEPTFDQAVLDQEKEVVLREITERSGDPEYIVYFYTMDSIFEPNSLDTHQTLGNSDCVAKTTVDDLVRLHQKALSTSQIVINVTGGGLNLDLIQKTIEEYLKLNLPAFASKERKVLDYQPENKLLEFNYKPIVHEQAHTQSNLTIFIPCKVNFENWSSLRLFEELFLKYYGRLYDTLRDKKGYVYGLYSSFRSDIQALEINMSCEIDYIQPIIEETKRVFSNFETNFDSKKLQELKKVLRLKVDLSSDSPTSINRFSNLNMFTFGNFQSYEDYEKVLNQVSDQDIQTIYNQIQTGLESMQVVAVSKDSKIQKVEF
jgi:mitochondrial-processing peptidase subunit beta